MAEVPLVKNFGTLRVLYRCGEFDDTVFIGLNDKPASTLVTVGRNIDLRTRGWTRAAISWCCMLPQDRKMTRKMAKALELGVLLAEAIDAGRVRAKFYKEKT